MYDSLQFQIIAPLVLTRNPMIPSQSSVQFKFNSTFNVGLFMCFQLVLTNKNSEFLKYLACTHLKFTPHVCFVIVLTSVIIRIRFAITFCSVQSVGNFTLCVEVNLEEISSTTAFLQEKRSEADVSSLISSQAKA